MGCSLALFLAPSAVGCRTREEGAQRAGREAALVAVHDCAGDAGLAEVCRLSICRDRCAPFADSVILTETCTTKCMGQGTCDSDADCDKGLICRIDCPTPAAMRAPAGRRCRAFLTVSPHH